MTVQLPAIDPAASAAPGGTDELRRLVTAAFAGYAGGDGHPCHGARSVVRRDTYDLQLYDRLGSAAAAVQLAADLARFGPAALPGVLTSFVAVFAEPTATDEPTFHRLLWRQLQLLHDVDRRTHRWDPRVSDDPDDPAFSFSVGGNAYFVIGLHAGSSRWARRFAWPTLVFNLHEQFAALRASGRYDRMRSTIRGRDAALQGDPNPVLDDFGVLSEARQYAGDEVPADWRCPLRVSPRR